MSETDIPLFQRKRCILASLDERSLTGRLTVSR